VYIIIYMYILQGFKLAVVQGLWPSIWVQTFPLVVSYTRQTFNILFVENFSLKIDFFAYNWVYMYMYISNGSRIS
jgi:hypothetical protein